MDVTVHELSEAKIVLKVDTLLCTEELIIKKTEHGYSHPDFTDWNMSDEEYYALETLVSTLIELAKGPLNLRIGG